MTEPDESAPAPTGVPSDDASPVRAARLRAGLRQVDVAEALQVPLVTFRRWDRGEAKPRSPQRQRQLATVLDSSLDTLFPTEDDPHVVTSMQAWEGHPPTAEDRAAEVTKDEPVSEVRPEVERRAERATEVAPAPSGAGRTEAPERRPSPLFDLAPFADTDESAGGEAPGTSGSTAPGVAAPPDRADPLPGGRSLTAGLPDPVEVLHTIDATRRVRLTASRPRLRQASARAATVFALAAIAVAGVAALASDDRTSSSPLADETSSVAFGLPTVVEALTDPIRRSLDEQAAGAKRLTGAASAAAERGDLRLAAERLDRLRSSYGTTPAGQRVRARITAIRERRAYRAADRRRAAARARAAAAKRAIAPPAIPAPAPASAAPAPANAAGAGSSTGTAGAGTSSGTAGSSPSPSPKRSTRPSDSQAVDPGLF